MSNMDGFTVISLLVIILFGILVIRRLFGTRKDPLGIDGKLIWVDSGRRTKPFFNNQFKILGKPDLMYKLATGGVLAVEFKSRNGRIYDSDVAQAKAAALAARGEGYAVREVMVKTKGTEQRFTLPKADVALHNEIKNFVEYARAAKKGANLKPLPQVMKCKFCAFGPSCDSRAV
jgi:hypothetical protein